MMISIVLRDIPCKIEGCTEKESERMMEMTKGYCIKHNLQRIVKGLNIDEQEEMRFREKSRSRFDR